MPHVDSTATDGRCQPAAAGCSTDPIAWLARLHARTLDRIQNPTARRLLQRYWLEPADAAGWPSWLLRSADGRELPHEMQRTYRDALALTVGEAVGALRVEAPPPDQLGAVWQECLAVLNLPSCRMLLSQQARLVELGDLAATVEVAASWLPMIESRRELLEAALHQTLGSPRVLVLVTGEEG